MSVSAAVCQVVKRWYSARGDYNRQELHTVECGDFMVAIVPAERCLDGATEGPCNVCMEHWNPPTGEDHREQKFCRYCGTYDDTTAGHGLGECIPEYIDDGPDV